MTTTLDTTVEKTATDLTSDCRQVQPAEILAAEDHDGIAMAMDNRALLAHVEKTLHNLRDNVPYLREARNRFSKPGQRVPVAGNPTWTEWVTNTLGKSVRTVQRWLEEPKKKKEKKTRPVKRLRDWQQAQRGINDFLAAAVILFKQQPVGSDMLMPALEELVALAGRQLVETPAPEPKLEPTVGKIQAPKMARTRSPKKPKGHKDTEPKVVDPIKEELVKLEEAKAQLRQAEMAKDTNAIAAGHGWAIDGQGHSFYQGADINGPLSVTT